MKCFIYEMFYLWNVLFMKCFIYEMFYFNDVLYLYLFKALFNSKLYLIQSFI